MAGKAPPLPHGACRTCVHGVALGSAMPRRQHLDKPAQHEQRSALLLLLRLGQVRPLLLQKEREDRGRPEGNALYKESSQMVGRGGAAGCMGSSKLA